MAKQDDFVRYTIRVPADLYARIQEAAGMKSVNAEIVATLEEKYPPPEGPTIDELFDEMDHLILEPNTPERSARISELTDQIEAHLEQKMEELKFIRSKTQPPKD